MRQLISGAVLLLALSGCASLNEQQCRRGDWAGIGLEDGRQGQPLQQLDAHSKACQRYGIQPDAELWRSQRTKGLEFYCQPLNGLTVGQRGGYYQHVCPSEREADFLAAWRIGYAEFDAHSRLQSLEQQASGLHAQLYRLGPGRERDHLQHRLYHLETRAFSDISRARHDLWQARERSAAYRRSLQPGRPADPAR